MATTEVAIIDTIGIDVREGYADVGKDIKLHYVEAGQGPLVVLLHGFPEFWFGWRLQIPALAAAGFRVVAPDLRGYNLSSKPKKYQDYGALSLADDVKGLIDKLGEKSAFLVGHDWGGTAAWQTAMSHPEVVERLAVLDAAHPRKLSEGLHHPSQLRRSWYFFYFQLPREPEKHVAANNWEFFKDFLRDANPPYTDAELAFYVDAWSQPGGVKAMLDYYRFAVRQPPWKASAQIHEVQAPTLVIWGQKDRYLGQNLAEPHEEDVPNHRVERLDEASHWVHHDAAESVNQLLIDFFGES
jgi:epoxide hydrolase 4